MAELFTEKYFPKNFAQYIGNSEISEKAQEWAKQWQKGEKQPPLLLWGQTGSGKTALAYLIAKVFGWEIVEMNSSDLRSKDSIEKVAGVAAQNASFFAKHRLILLDEIDALSRNDRGGVSAISALVKNAQNPVVLTATDIFSDKGISALRFVCKTFEFKKINYLSIANHLMEILRKEGKEFDPEAVKELAKNSSGDMRSALLDIETLALSDKITLEEVKTMGARERQQKVFSIMKAIFKGVDIKEIRDIRSQSDLSNDQLFAWVDENIPRQYKDPHEVAMAFNRLSRADIFNGRIYNKQHWGFLRYSTALAAEGVALSKDKPSYDFTMYQFPGLLSMLSRTSGVRAIKKSIGSKIGEKTHSSIRKVISADLPFLRDVFVNQHEKAVAMSATFGLDEKEIAFLLDTKPETKKVQSIIEEAQIIMQAGAKPKYIFGEGHSGEEDEKPDKVEESEDANAKQTKLF